MRLYTLLCPSVRLSVGWCHFTFFYDFYISTSTLLTKWSSDLKYRPSPPARNWGSRVSGLVFSKYLFLAIIDKTVNHKINPFLWFSQVFFCPFDGDIWECTCQKWPPCIFCCCEFNIGTSFMISDAVIILQISDSTNKTRKC